MSELAINLNGNSFDVPKNAVGWRVRKLKSKGATEIVYGRNGQPLVLPLDADVDDLRAEVRLPGRYRLDAVDQANKPISRAPAAFVFVQDVARAPRVAASSMNPRDGVVIEAMRMTAEIARSVIDRFPQMIAATVTLLRPAREVERAAPEKRPRFDLGALLLQLAPLLGVVDLAKLGAMFGRKAKLKTTPKLAKDLIPENARDVLPPIDAQTMAHFVAVQSALTTEEAALVRDVGRGMSATELRAWFDELSKLAVPDAVAKVRKLISGQRGSATTSS